MVRYKAQYRTYAELYLNRLRVHARETAVHWGCTLTTYATIKALLSLLILTQGMWQRCNLVHSKSQCIC